MKRSTRAELARRTVEIVERGRYTLDDGRVVDIGEAVRSCLASTRFFDLAGLEALRRSVLATPAVPLETTVEVVNETTLAGIARILEDGPGPVAALNFASAKNPGGGFLNGSRAQEESLARSSALHASQLRAWDFYERHRGSPSLLYSDAMILSPGCPVFVDDAGTLLDRPRLAAFITSAAPNAGAASGNRRDELAAIPEVFARRSEYVLALALSHGYKRLVLGAWGCGVFRNDPNVVAGAFARHLDHRWAGRFERVVFSVLDDSPSRATFGAFRDALDPDGRGSTARDGNNRGAIMAGLDESHESADPHDLNRFLEAQQEDYDQALAEIRSGRKRSHWIWYVFPQVDGLGFSSMSKRYAIKGLDEVRAYLAHPVLGPRLVECAEALLAVEGRSAREILGSPDDLKVRSCATLFASVAPEGSAFHQILDRYYEGRRDPRTLAILSGGK